MTRVPSFLAAYQSDMEAALERGGDLDGEIAPSTMYSTFQATWPETRALIEHMAEAQSHDVPDATRAIVRRAVEVDAAARAMALHPDLRESDLLSVYFPRSRHRLNHAPRATTV